MGGTFDPVHIGHLVIAEEARDSFELEKVIFVPSARPPHKGGISYAPAEDRLEMVQLATRDNYFLEASDIEIKRKGLSFTIDTLHKLRELYGRDSELFFITGTDAIIEIPTWKEPVELLSESKFIVATRPGYSLEELHDSISYMSESHEIVKKRIFPMESPGLEVSSTSIRERISKGRPFRYLLPEAVWKYIEDKGLYA
ncbi:MAG: nicotinate-nucleotide adenylyltransferase [Actinobacteria bacterium]|nr:nicotinate-nucleotide adenylyltransferase [Actinomycetota bacterium]